MATTAEPDRSDLHAVVREVYGHAAASREAHRILSGRCPPGQADSSRPGACGAGRGLGCGNPLALAQLRPGENVLDLGSGAGFDCLAAAVEVGRQGRVIGIDLTPEMVGVARRNAADAGAPMVSFLVGDIERLPLADALFDIVLSNCVINLCPNKTAAFREAHRVLRRGGRLAVSDIVATAPFPGQIAGDMALYAGCVAGAPSVEQLSRSLRDAGFTAIRIEVREQSRNLIATWAPGRGLERYITAADITAKKC